MPSVVTSLGTWLRPAILGLRLAAASARVCGLVRCLFALLRIVHRPENPRVGGSIPSLASALSPPHDSRLYLNCTLPIVARAPQALMSCIGGGLQVTVLGGRG
jgi:hypothetical protein